MKKGDKVKVNGTGWCGVIRRVVMRTGMNVVHLDNGMEISCKDDCLTLVTEDNLQDNCNTTVDAPQEIPESNNRDEKGRFVKGCRINNTPKVKTVRQTRKELLAQIQPFISKIGTIISMIDEPQEQILALTRMMKFCVPTYSAIEFTENAPRSLSAEEKLIQLNAQYNHLPDPIKKTDEEDEENED